MTRIRGDRLGPIPDAPRQLLVWIWYPATPAPGAAPAPYLPTPWARANDAAHGIGQLLFQSSSTVQAHAVAQAHVAPQAGGYPVLLMMPGLGNSAPEYTVLAEALASSGYVVVGITPPYSSRVVVFPDGHRVDATEAGQPDDPAGLNQLVADWSQDEIFVLDQLAKLDHDPQDPLAGRLDLTRVGAWGHSFGGATALQTCHAVAHCQAAADLDGAPFGDVVQKGLPKPVLFLNSEATGQSDPCCPTVEHDIRAILHSAPPHAGYEVILHGAAHFNFEDEALFFEPFMHLIGVLGPLDGTRGLQITGAYLRAFFDSVLRQVPAPLLQGPSPTYPEITFVVPPR